MKIITLKKNETIKIGDIQVTFLRKRSDHKFELGVNAPQTKLIHREEYFVVLKKDREQFLKNKKEHHE